ncbi:hypothetical protein CEP54_008561 [Fusarium duplospermum]|uniref:Uncharacterized protein n=1 Tax=Fusarium duplospermum TaxID=1325734 RepID=A0A428PVC3_9HYPO|nr:hypothetical protein CEP54_008561 [Fusarium duplospermum]
MVVVGARASVEAGGFEVPRGLRLKGGGGEAAAVDVVVAAAAAATTVGGSHVAAGVEGLVDVVVAGAGNSDVEPAGVAAAAVVGMVGLVDGVAAVADARAVEAEVVADLGMYAVGADSGVEAADKSPVAVAPVVDIAGLATVVVDLVGDAVGLAADTGLAVGIAGLTIDAVVEAVGTDLVAAAEENEHRQLDSAELPVGPVEDTAADAHIDQSEPEDIDSAVDGDTVVDLAEDESAGHST